MRLLSTLAVFFMLAPVLAVTARQSNGCGNSWIGAAVGQPQKAELVFLSALCRTVP